MNEKVLELILTDGSFDGGIKAKVKQHGCHAVKISRDRIQAENSFDNFTIGCYLLICEDAAPGVNQIYVGESTNVYKRLLRHINDYSNGVESFYWHTAVAIFGQDLNKSHYLFIENEIKKRLENNGHKCLTQKTSSDSPLSNADKILCNNLMPDISDLLCVFGLPVLSVKSPHTDSDMLFCSGAGANAKGFQSSGGFYVVKGSKVSDGIASSLESSSYGTLRKQLEQAGTIKEGIFTYPYEFSSPSAAASVILGSPTSGLAAWKNIDGKSLKELSLIPHV